MRVQVWSSARPSRNAARTASAMAGSRAGRTGLRQPQLAGHVRSNTHGALGGHGGGARHQQGDADNPKYAG